MINLSCGVQDNACIEADDFGNYDNEIIDVRPFKTNGEVNPEYCSLQNDDRDTSYARINTGTNAEERRIKTVLYNCLTSTYIHKIDSNNVSYTCKNLYELEYSQCTNESCKEQSDIEISNCEQVCISQCFFEPSNKNSWIANKSVLVKPGTLISLNVSGEINFDDSAILNVGTLLFNSMIQNKEFGISYASSANTLTDGYPQNISDYSSKLLLRLIFDDSAISLSKTNNQSILQQQVASGNILQQPVASGNIDINKFYRLINKNILVSNQYPEPYSADSNIPIKSDPTYTKCKIVDNNILINNPKKISCSESKSEDEYTAPYDRKNSSEAYNFGTDISIKEYGGGYVRNSEMKEEKDYEKKSLESASLDNNFVTLQSNQSISFNNNQDRYLQLKVSDKSCINTYVNVLINNSSATVFEIKNLLLTDSFSIEEIPLYSNSTFKITQPDCISSGCPSAINNNDCYKKIVATSKKYHDLIMPNSGFVSFKINNIENQNTGNQNCNLFGRIINSEGSKEKITKSLNYSSVNLIQINQNSNSFSNPDPSNLEEDYTIKGVFNYANSAKSDIIISSTCSSNSASSFNTPATCQTGVGLNGGGGGNIGGDSSKNKIATSYINPEFVYEDMVEPYSSDRGAAVSGANGLSGEIIFESHDGSRYNVIAPQQGDRIIIDQNRKCIVNNVVKSFCVKFHIVGGAGGASSCSQGSTIGLDGDKFSGIIDLSKHTSNPQSFELHFKKGSGGLCNGQAPSSQPYLNGGQGQNSGSGGSASYIYMQRSDDGRNDFLVIAAGGNGGNPSSSLLEFSKPSSRLETNVLGISWVKKFINKKTITENAVSDHYHEFFYDFKNNSDDDILNNKSGFLVSQTSISQEFFARKGQIIRIYPEKSFYNQFWDSGIGPKECGVGMMMIIKPRPSIICLNTDHTYTDIKNPFCTPYYPTSGTQSSAPLTQQGCMPNNECKDLFYRCTSPLKAQNAKCYEVTCSGGSPTTANICTESQSITPSGCNCDANHASNCTSQDSTITDVSCRNCRADKIEKGQKAPFITITYPNCYVFSDSKSVSAHKVLKNISTASEIANYSNYSIKLIDKYPAHEDGLMKFGKFPFLESSLKRSGQSSFSWEAKADINLKRNQRLFGLSVVNNNLKEFTAIDTERMVFDVGKSNSFNDGQHLKISLCKETNSESKLCIAETLTSEKLKILNGSSVDNFMEINNFGEAIVKDKTKFASPLESCPLKTVENGDAFFCFNNDIADETESSKYKISFKIDDPDNIYTNNSGKYKVALTVKKTNSNGLGLVNKILDPIIEKIDGKSSSSPSPQQNTVNFVEISYKYLISSYFYKTLLQTTIILLLTFYGMGYLIGINEMKHSEIVKIVLKIAIVFVFTSTQFGYIWFEKFFISFFKDAIDFLTFMTAQIFDNSPELSQAIAKEDYTNKGLLFISVDKLLNTLITSAVQNKITALIFSSIWGWLYFLIIVHAILLYFYAIANSVLLFITCQLITSILLSLAPIFFIMLFFNITKDIFDNWLKALIGFSLQQIFLVMTLSFFNILFYEFLKYAIGYRVCWTEILSFFMGGRKISLAHYWNVAGTNNSNLYDTEDIDESFGNDENMPSLYSFLTLWIVAGMMKQMIDLFTSLAVTLAGGVKASTIGGDIKSGGQKLFGALSEKATKFYQMTVGRAVSNIDNVLFASGKIAKAERKAKQQQFAQDMKTRASLMMYGDKAVSEYKKNNALEFSGLSRSEQKEKLREVRSNAMEKFAARKGIENHEQILNKTGLNYHGTNLFGALVQAGKQGVSSGGNLFNSGYDRKVKTSFSKSEANQAISKMENKTDRDKFVENIEAGNLKVNRGGIDIVKDSFYSVKDTLTWNKDEKRNLVKDNLTSAKNYIGDKLGSIKKPIARKIGRDDDKNIAIDRLVAKGKITSLSGQKTGLIHNFVNWSRSDKEKRLIRDEVRNIRNERKVFSENTKNPQTSTTVIRDLKNTLKYHEDKESKTSFRASLDNIANRINPFEVNKLDNVQKTVKPSPNDDKEIQLKYEKQVLEKRMESTAGKFDEIKKQNPAIKILNEAKNLDLTKDSDRKIVRDKIADVKTNKDTLSKATSESLKLIEGKLDKYESFPSKSLEILSKIPGVATIAKTLGLDQKSKTEKLERDMMAKDENYEDVAKEYKLQNAQLKIIDKKLDKLKNIK